MLIREIEEGHLFFIILVTWLYFCQSCLPESVILRTCIPSLELKQRSRRLRFNGMLISLPFDELNDFEDMPYAFAYFPTTFRS